jgi:iron complex outermembrane receptor protein
MDRVAGSGKWFYEPNQRFKVGIIARGMKLYGESPGFLDRADVLTRPRSSPAYAAPDAGKQHTLHLSAHLDAQLASSVSLQLKAYVQSLYRERNVSFDPSEQQNKRRDDELQHGAIATLTYRARGARAHGFALEWGADYQQQLNDSRRYKTIARIPQGAPTRDFDFTFAVAGSYVQASIKPARSLKLVAAIRGDYLWGTLEDKVKNEKHGMRDFGVIWQPKVGAAWSFYEGQRLYANYGRTYQVGTQAAAYESASGKKLEPSINDGFEVGVRSMVAPWLTTHVAAWEQLASQEVRLKPDMSGDSENIGKTKRYGLDLESTISPVPWLSLWGSFSPVVAKQSEPGAANPERRGKELNHVPWYSAKGGIDYTKVEGLLISLWCYAQSDFYLTKENDTPQYGGYYVVNLDTKYTVTPWLDLGLSVQNLTNAEYDIAVWYKDYGSAGSQHSPGAPVSAFASATLSL